ncbi:FAD-dependent oxidoreductase [Ramlibacter algicola]|uniref:FAD-dependent monooxygenase n=1 Tax=Ramlibacter algicola TaxID=2795217 RepID=A0A934PZ27_9BURK|nr:NAD(P)/FAD-dependent oxidoreductase [Ramlibacter algicola]MBK0391682.1 FAD-dependent monooxygenase [Ramlibacter algicola]
MTPSDEPSAPAGDAHVADVAIAGGGLAGSAIAAVLARKGFEVVLIDPHAVYPPDLRCEKLDASQVATLERTGLAGMVLPAASRYASIWVPRFGRFIEKHAETQYGIPYDTLVNRVRATIPAGVRRVAGKVTAIANGEQQQALLLSTGETVRARLAVIANGLNSGLRNGLGIVRKDVSRCHSVTIAFDVRPQHGGTFGFPALTYYGERPGDRCAYFTLFPVPGAMRANLFAYREAADPWLRDVREQPEATLHRTLPGLRRVIGPIEVVGPVKVRPADLYESHGCLLPGVVLVGDAFATSCPAAGTGTNKVFTDVDILCNVHVPEWMRTPGMGVDKLASFYRDPVKAACDQFSMRKAFSLRSDSIDVGLAPGMRRWSRITKGAARAVRSAVRRPQRQAA